MPTFDRTDGIFVARCTFQEREIFKSAGWLFDRTKKRWVTDDTQKALVVEEHAVGDARLFLDNYALVLKARVAASLAEDTDKEYPAPEGLSYLPFQKAGIEYALARHRTLIADAPGLGKTVQAIGVNNAVRATSVLVVCPASLKINWSREWRRWDVHGMSVGIAMSVPKRITGVDEHGQKYTKTYTVHDWPDTDVVIVNYDMLETFDSHVKSRNWGLVVCDEAHLLKSSDAIRTKCVFGGTKKEKRKNGKTVEKAKKFTAISAERHLYLTGTPILSKPVELWTLLKACDANGLGSSYEKFVHEFCDAYQDVFCLNVDGASNLDKLNRLLRERFMVRRDKKSVLKDLPPKTRELIILPRDKLDKIVQKEKTNIERALDKYEEVLGIKEEDRDFRYIAAVDSLSDHLERVYNEYGGDSLDWDDLVKHLAEPEQILFSEISAAREEVALASMSLVADIIVKLVQCNEPVICFLYHKSVVKLLAEKLTALGLRVGVVTGQTSQKARQKAVDDFQAGLLDVIIGNLIAMGVGYTLTISSYVVVGEIDWIPSLLEQAEDRAWRHGQKNAVSILYPVVDGSITARMIQKVLERMGVIRLALDMVPT